MTKDSKETDEFRESYRLAPGFNVELSNIRGPVDIECHDNDEAQVHIVSHAATRTDLDQGKATVEQNENTLTVRGAAQGRAAQEVRLKLPRHIALAVDAIRGPLRIGEVAGPVTVNSISGPCHIAGTNGALTVKSVSGPIEVGRLNGALSVSSVSGPVTAGIAALDENGVHIKNISGPVTLLFEDQVDADMIVEHVSGKISIKVEGAVRKESKDGSSVHVVVGEGKSPVSISSISGPVRIKRRG